jgi:hypothetical protein
MDTATSHGILRAVSFLVLALMLVGIAYAAYIAATYWTGIGV